MAADAFKGIITFTGVTRGKNGALVATGGVYQEPVSADDVAGNKLTFDRTGETSYRPPETVMITDITNAEDGNDTSRWELFVNGAATNYNFGLGQLLATTPQPHVTSKPIIGAHQLIQLFQRA